MRNANEMLLLNNEADMQGRLFLIEFIFASHPNSWNDAKRCQIKYQHRIE